MVTSLLVRLCKPGKSFFGQKLAFSRPGEALLMRYSYPFVIGEGKNVSCWISTDDLAEVVCFVIKEALEGPKSRLGYGKDGYYFCEASELEVMEQALVTAKALSKLGAIQTSSVVSISPQQSMKLNDWAVLLWGSGMRTRADKLRALGWKPKTEDWVPFVVEMAKVEVEAKKAAVRRRRSLRRHE